MQLTAAHGSECALAGAAGKGVVDQRPVQHRPDVGHNGMMQHALPKNRGMNDAGFGIANVKSDRLTDGNRTAENLRLQDGEMSVKALQKRCHFRAVAFAGRLSLSM